MNDANRLHYGLSMEREAEAWLLHDHPGRRVLARNYRARGGEIDLVIEEGSAGVGPLLVFVEVRARSPGAWVSALESVTLPKLFRLRRAIEIYLASYRGPARGIRVDVLAWDGKAWAHAPDIRLPERARH